MRACGEPGEPLQEQRRERQPPRLLRRGEGGGSRQLPAEKLELSGRSIIRKTLKQTKIKQKTNIIMSTIIHQSKHNNNCKKELNSYALDIILRQRRSHNPNTYPYNDKQHTGTISGRAAAAAAGGSSWRTTNMSSSLSASGFCSRTGSPRPRPILNS